MAFLKTNFLQMRGRANCLSSSNSSKHHIYRSNDTLATISALNYFPAYFETDEDSVLIGDDLLIMASDGERLARITAVTPFIVFENDYFHAQNVPVQTTSSPNIFWVGPGGWEAGLDGGATSIVQTGSLFSITIPTFSSTVVNLDNPIRSQFAFATNQRPLADIYGAIGYIQASVLVAGYFHMTSAGILTLFPYNFVPPGGGNWGMQGFTMSYRTA